jgi:hypothetical protein
LSGPYAVEPTTPLTVPRSPSTADAPLSYGAVEPVPPLAAPRAPSADEETHYPNMYRRFGLSAGAALYSNFDTTVQVSGDAGAGTVLDLEDFLDVDENNLVARLDAFYSFTPRHRIDLGVYDISRDGSKTTADDITIGDVVIPAGRVETSLDTLIVKLAYRYNFVADTRTAIGASFGFHTMGIDLALESADVLNVDEKVKMTAPLPVIGLHAEYALGERWKLLGSAELFQVDLGFAGGFLADNRLAIEHDLFDHVGWGLALNGFQLDADVEDGSLNADLEYAYQGAMLFLRAYW